jgi:hypothetical protein
MTTARFRRYRNPKTGDDFVFMSKGHVLLPNTPGWDSSYDIDCATRNLLMMSSDIKLSPINDGWFDVPYIDGTASFDSVKCQLISSMFAHGGCHARIISGPTFDEALALPPAHPSPIEKTEAGQ